MLVFTGRGVLTLALLLTPATITAAPPPLVLAGTVRLPPLRPPGPGKKFRGVLLEVNGGESWVLSYTRDGLWQTFDGFRVVVRGNRFVPPGQALMAPHLRVHSWKAADPKKEITTFVEVGPLETWTGIIQQRAWPAGTKLGGATYLELSIEGGGSLRLANRPDGIRPGRRARVAGRRVVYSPFVTHAGGDTAWVLQVSAASR